MRGWTFIHEGDYDGDSDLKKQIRREMIEKLAAEWNTTHSHMEHRSWRSEEDMDEEADYLNDQATDYGDEASYECKQKGGTDEECKAAFEKAFQAYFDEVERPEEKMGARMEVIEELLEELGVRMMRPYEHHNEDERYYEYMENRYSSDDDRY